jgi:hypothetical protein
MWFVTDVASPEEGEEIDDSTQRQVNVVAVASSVSL